MMMMKRISTAIGVTCLEVVKLVRVPAVQLLLPSLLPWNDSTADNFLASCFVLAGSHTEATQMAMLDSFKTAWIHTLNNSCVYNFSVISAPLIGSP